MLILSKGLKSRGDRMIIGHQFSQLPPSSMAGCFHLAQQVGLDFSDGLLPGDSVYIPILGVRGGRVRIPGVREKFGGKRVSCPEKSGEGTERCDWVGLMSHICVCDAWNLTLPCMTQALWEAGDSGVGVGSESRTQREIPRGGGRVKSPGPEEWT